jgi:serine protease Do
MPAVAQGRYLGITEEPVTDASGQQTIKVAAVYPGSPAERAGLQPGDVIHSINGYLTEQRGNLSWIVANAAPDNLLKMNVRTARDGQDHTITARLP